MDFKLTLPPKFLSSMKQKHCAAWQHLKILLWRLVGVLLYVHVRVMDVLNTQQHAVTMIATPATFCALLQFLFKERN